MNYKLIKIYPGSAELNSTATIDEEPSPKYYTHKIKSINGTTFGYINKPEQYPEFWEEVVEKDYEILSFTNSEKAIYTKGAVGRFDARYQMYRPTEEDCLEEPGFSIHSVKRLSDGEVFTIGDRLDEKCFRKLSRHHLSEGIYDNIITKIGIVKEHASEVAGHLEIQNGKLMFSASNKWNNLNVLLSEAIKYKQPLFTTEDGVDVFEGEYYYPVEKEFYFLHKKQTNHHCTNEEKFWIFSTKEKAKEYILYNKPCLSYGDIQEYLKVKDCNKVLNLIQEKLK